MCPDCKELLEHPHYRPSHLVNPVTQRLNMSDPWGRRICPDLHCLSLWQSVQGSPWKLIETKGGLGERKPMKRVKPTTSAPAKKRTAKR